MSAEVVARPDFFTTLRASLLYPLSHLTVLSPSFVTHLPFFPTHNYVLFSFWTNHLPPLPFFHVFSLCKRASRLSHSPRDLAGSSLSAAPPLESHPSVSSSTELGHHTERRRRPCPLVPFVLTCVASSLTAQTEHNLVSDRIISFLLLGRVGPLLCLVVVMRWIDWFCTFVPCAIWFDLMVCVVCTLPCAVECPYSPRPALCLCFVLYPICFVFGSIVRPSCLLFEVSFVHWYLVLFVVYDGLLPIFSCLVWHVLAMFLLVMLGCCDSLRVDYVDLFYQ
jgi:hypothetical protein